MTSAIAKQLADPQHVRIRASHGYVCHSDSCELWKAGDPIRFTRLAAVSLIARHHFLHDAVLEDAYEKPRATTVSCDGGAPQAACAGSTA